MKMINRPVKISPFRYWCQQTLPLTFDDSLSYMELLSRVIKHLNDAVADVATAEQDIINLHNAFVQLQSYVNDYFQNLDVQTEVDHKIDEMVENGTFDQLLDPIVGSQIAGVVADQIGAVVANQIGAVVANQIDDVVEEQIGDVVGEQIGGVVSEQIGAVVANQIDNVVAEQIDGAVEGQIDDAVGGQIGDAVGDWLDDNLTPTTPPIDKTLTIPNAAADAKVVGDKFSEIADFESNLLEDYHGVNRLYEGQAVDDDTVPLYTSASDAVSAESEGYYVLFARLKWEQGDEATSSAKIMPSLFVENRELTPVSFSTTSFSRAGYNAFTQYCLFNLHDIDIAPNKLYVKFAFVEYGNNPYTTFQYKFTVIDVGLIKFGSRDSAAKWIAANCPNIGVAYEYPTKSVELIAEPIGQILERLEGVEEKLPPHPVPNGNYKLRCTVLNGVATYSWVAE